MTDKPDRGSIISFSDFTWTVLRSRPVQAARSATVLYSVGGVIVVLAVVFGIFFWQSTHGHGSSQDIPPPPVSMTNPEPGLPSDAQAALATVVARVGFPVLLPTYFATSADRLTWVNDGPHPADPKLQSPPQVDAMYFSDRTVTIDGKPFHPSVEVQPLHSVGVGLEVKPGVKGPPAASDVVPPISSDAAGYVLYERVIYRAPDGTPVRVMYTAVRGDTIPAKTTIILIFNGEQPTMANLTKMLASFKAVSP